ncbi:MAG: hypothetical protein ACE366_02885 [Bradymonadia bacterium]
MRRLCTLLIALATLIPTFASACWSGIYLSGERLTIRVAEDDLQWTPELAQKMGALLIQGEALLPHGVQVEVDFGQAEICEGPDHCRILEGVTLDNLLSRLALEMKLPARAIKEVQAMETPVYVVRIPTDDVAHVARQINADDAYLHGNMEVGDFPGLTAQALPVVKDEIWVGTFIDKFDAEKAAWALIKMGHSPVVHQLGTPLKKHQAVSHKR